MIATKAKFLAKARCHRRLNFSAPPPHSLRYLRAPTRGLQRSFVLMVIPSTMTRRSKCSARQPHFFKVLLGDFKQRLKIPPNFMRHIAKEAPQRVILQGPNGGSWPVVVSKTIEGDFLSAGWSNFVKNHTLKEHEFLVFRYDREMHFSVMIFDTTACEREDLFEMNIPKKCPCEGKHKHDPPMKPSLCGGCIRQHQQSRSELPKLLSGVHTSPKSTDEARTRTEDVELSNYRPKRYKIYVSGRRPVTTKERSKAEEVANSFNSPFPYTILHMKSHTVYKTFMLRFPHRFARIHLPDTKTKMILRDPSGRVWKVVYIPSSNAKTQSKLSAGWSKFALGNNLEEGDFCAFELIGKLELRVHIFRVVDEITPFLRSYVERH